MISQWITENLVFVVTTILIPTVTWFFTKRHFTARELKTKDLDIDASSSDIIAKKMVLYQKMLDDLDARYETSIARRDFEVARLEKLTTQQRVEIDELKSLVADLKIEVSTLIHTINELKQRLTTYEEGGS